jgi:small subunit ribosomal protein S15
VASLFHTSAVAPAAVAHARVVGSLHPETPRNANKTESNRDRSARKRKARPHPVLGHRIGNESLWLNSDLCKALIDEEKLAQAPVESLHIVGDTVSIPKNLAFGIGEQERKVLFEHLPTLSAQHIPKEEGGKASASGAEDGFGISWLPNDSEHSWMVKQRIASGEHQISPEDLEAAEARERYKLKAVTQALDLRNANAAGLAYENRRRCITAFSSPENPYDPGRPEVQGMYTFCWLNVLLFLRLREFSSVSSCYPHYAYSKTLDASQPVPTGQREPKSITHTSA